VAVAGGQGKLRRRPHGFLTRADQKAAAFIAGSSKPAFVADVESVGRISATRTEAGAIEVEPVELFRVFPPLAMQRAPQEAMHPLAKADATAESALRVNALEVEVKMLREMLDAMRDDRNAWRDQAARWWRCCPRRLRPSGGRGGGGW